MSWLRRLFCDHDWKETARSVVSPPAYGIHEIRYTDRAKFIVGFTTIVHECSRCRKTRSLEMLGEQQQPQKPASLHLLKPNTRGPFK
jgi:hypothetical protein